MFQRLYNYILLFKEYAILAGLILLSLLLLVFNDNLQVRHIRSVTTIAFGVVQNQFAFIPQYFGLKSENALLRKLNIDLADEVNQLREARLENIRLRQLLQLKEFSQYRAIAASVVNKNLSLLRNTITLNVGRADGIEEKMPVVGIGGLVGVVAHCTDHFSVVRILLNTDFRASVKVQRSRVDGIIAWDGTSLILKNVTKKADVIVGDLVLTTAYSSTYPADLRVGIVTDVQEPPGSLFKNVVLNSAVDFIKLEEVFVLTSLPTMERFQLEQPSTLHTK
ncbi:MAG: rod shape-determining protein MreC [bacterium]